VLTGLMVSGRVGSGDRGGDRLDARHRSEYAALRALGTDPVRKLVVPRVLAGVLSMMPLLSVASPPGSGWWRLEIVTVLQFHVASNGSYWSSRRPRGLYIQDVVDGADQAESFSAFNHRDDRLPRRPCGRTGGYAGPSANSTKPRGGGQLGGGDCGRLHGDQGS